MPRTTTTTLLAAGALLLLAAGCGGDDDAADPTTGADGSGVQVIAKDVEFDADSYEAAAGDVEIAYENQGALEHTLVIEGVDGFRLEVPSRGDTDEGSVELEAGSYVLFCDIDGHRDAGMEADLEVG